MKKLLLYSFFILNTTAVFSQTLTGSKLEISSTNSHLARFYYDDNNAGQTRPRLDIWGTPNKINIRTTYNTGGAQLSFGTHHVNDALLITNHGRIGIGTTNPGAKLHVYGSSINQGETSASIMLGKLRGPEIRAIQGLQDNDVQELAFHVKRSNSFVESNFEAVRIKYNGYVGIGTESPDARLTVAGNIHAREVKVTATAGGADFVFADDYALPKLAEVAAFVKENKHLPEIPSAAEMEANGLHLAEMNIKLLQKLEELTLYTIEQENQLTAQQASINTQKEQLAEKDRQFQDLLDRMERLEQQIQE